MPTIVRLATAVQLSSLFPWSNSVLESSQQLLQSYLDWSKVVDFEAGLLALDPRIGTPREIPICDRGK
jgi:hypothetical protein